jgi:SnoaL-like domain
MKPFLLSTALILGSAPLLAAEGTGPAPLQPRASTATTDLAPVGDIDTAKVMSTVSSIPLAVDLAAYDLAEQAFALSIMIDYTSLWGGEPATMTPAELMTAWRGIVPGFDATWHALSDVQATVTGDTATATALSMVGTGSVINSGGRSAPITGT